MVTVSFHHWLGTNTHNILTYQRGGSLFDIQDEFSNVAPVMNSLHGLLHLRVKHSNNRKGASSDYCKLLVYP